MGVYNMPPYLGIVRNVDTDPDENVDGDLIRWSSADRAWKRVLQSSLILDGLPSRVGAQFQFLTVNGAEDDIEFTEFSLDNLTKTTSYSMTDDDSVILADATAGAMTITLPRPSDTRRRVITIKKIDTTGNVVTVATV